MTAEGERFSASGREILELGWKKVTTAQEEDEEEAAEQVLPNLKQGDVFPCRNVQLKTLKTAPPARYTEATLLSAMENPSRFIEDRAMKEYIGGGLGTPATRADIIEKLFTSFYVEKKGNSLVPTSKGMQLINLVPPDLKEPLLTARWEKRLEGISKGAENKNVFIKEIKGYASSLVKTVSASEAKYVHENLTQEVCPECGKRLLMVNSKKGKMLVCQDRTCGYRRNVVVETRVRCPNCHKFMELFGEGEKKTFVCRCGFRSKADKLFANKDKDAKASKRDVQQYLDSQNKKKEEGVSAFAAAWAKSLEEAKKKK